MSDKEYNNIHELFSSLDALRTNSTTTLSDVVTWFSKNINKACQILTGENHTAFGDTMSYNWTLALNDAGYYNVEIDVNSLRSSGKRHEEFIMLVNDATNLVDIKVNHKLGMTIGLCYEFDLKQWPILVKSILSNSLYNLVVDNKSTLAAKTKANEDIDILLSCYYPSLSKDFLMTAADLGVVTFDEGTFVIWLDEHLAQSKKHYIPPALPDSFT